jgi:hypothetical protein|tara:strand:- start:50 stop:244 length:195 start_codon:yes stop_codon:yes gene_type:complete
VDETFGKRSLSMARDFHAIHENDPKRTFLVARWIEYLSKQGTPKTGVFFSRIKPQNTSISPCVL